MKTSHVVLLAVVVAFWLSGCATYTLVSPGNIKVSGCCSVETPIEWSRSGAGNMEVWTIDGASLEAIYFFKGIRDGETLFNTYNKKIKLPKFRNAVLYEAQVDPKKRSEWILFLVRKSIGQDQQDLSGYF